VRNGANSEIIRHLKGGGSQLSSGCQEGEGAEVSGVSQMSHDTFEKICNDVIIV